MGMGVVRSQQCGTVGRRAPQMASSAATVAPSMKHLQGTSRAGDGTADDASSHNRRWSDLVGMTSGHSSLACRAAITTCTYGTSPTTTTACLQARPTAQAFLTCARFTATETADAAVQDSGCRKNLTLQAPLVTCCKTTVARGRCDRGGASVLGAAVST